MPLEDNVLTHVDEKNNPVMVDIADKKVTIRMASAQSQIQLPVELRQFFVGNEIYLKKGAVFQTAIIAATMAVKKTSELIPFCHQIPIEACKVEIKVDDNLLVSIICEVKTTFKTGVEMEALHGAVVAALTIYDMCKAVSHQMIIKETKLLAKTGGKNTLFDRPTYGLVLTGGRSERMERDKALISYRGKPHAKHIFDILQGFCDQVFISARKDQWEQTELASLPRLDDQFDNVGPLAGMLTAFNTFADVNWIIVACDLVHFNSATVERLLSYAHNDKVATCFRNRDKDFPEALCGFYTPKAREVFMQAYQGKITCPVKILRSTSIELVDQNIDVNLANINTPLEFESVKHEIN